MSSIGIKYGQFAQVLARIKAAFEADGFNPKEAKNIIESVKHDVLNGMMQIVEVKPKGRMLFDDFLTSYIEDMETGRRTKKGRTVKVSPAYIKVCALSKNRFATTKRKHTANSDWMT